MNVPDMSYRKKHKDAMIRVVELETQLNVVRELIRSVVEDNDIDRGYMRLRSYWDFEEQQLKDNNDE